MLMLFNNWLLMFYLFFMGSVSFILTRKHLLSMLLSLEFIVLSLFFMVLYFLSFLNFELYFCMFFLIFSVCEGALGVSLMVLMIRSHGNDYFKSLSILQC